MDNRLDFYNDINKFISSLEDGDTMLVLTHNKKNGDTIISFNGDEDAIYSIVGVSEFVNHVTEQSKENISQIRTIFFNATLYAMAYDESLKNKMIEAINSIDHKHFKQ